jgi:lysine-N-methylase
VLARRHVIRGEEIILLHDLGTGRVMQIGPREWGLIAAADGTRDVPGIVIAAAREGAHARIHTLKPFLHQLHEAGMLEDGTDELGKRPPEASAADADDGAATRPLWPLPGFTMHCDGSGSCCRFYGSVIFGPLEAARARALMPEVLDGGAKHEKVFTPERGSGPTGGAVVAYCEGRCAYLRNSGRCGLHDRGGPKAKPLGCRMFPAAFVDDGESVRVTVSVECACVLASVDRPDGEPLLPARWKVRGDLDETIVVDQLDEHVMLTASTTAPRAAFMRWERAVAERFAEAEDPAAALWSLARAVEAEGLDEAAARQAIDCAQSISVDELKPWAEALEARAKRWMRQDTWRGEYDLVRGAVRNLDFVAMGLTGEESAPFAAKAPPALRSERFYVAALLHGHRLAHGRPLPVALRDRAFRIVAARALGILQPERRDPAFAHPLAIVEATLRGHGLDLYVEDVA